MSDKTVTMSRELAESALTIVSRNCTSNWSARVKDGIESALAAPADELRAVLAQEAGKCEPVAWANGEQLKLCAASPREVQPNNHMLHNLPRNIAGSALPTEYCNTPLFASPPAPVSVPDGWKLVPVEPTELMIRRGDQNYSWSVAKIYAAMIADAPNCLD